MLFVPADIDTSDDEVKSEPAIVDLRKKEEKPVIAILKNEANSVIPAMKKEEKSVTPAPKNKGKAETCHLVKDNKKVSTPKERNAVASSSKATPKNQKKRKADETVEAPSPKKLCQPGLDKKGESTLRKSTRANAGKLKQK